MLTIAGWLSDAWSLETALTVMPAFGLLAAGLFMVTSCRYEVDLKRVDSDPVNVGPELEPPSVSLIGPRAAATT